MIVVVSLIAVPAAFSAWRDILAALIVEMTAAWLLTVLPLPRRPRRRASA
ncbi:hypothetical protein [Streptomyces sp. NPDC005438]